MRTGFSISAVAAATASALIIGTSASAHQYSPDPATGGLDDAAVPPAVEEVLGEGVEPLGNGLYEVPVPGRDLITHGPDPEPALDSRLSRQSHEDGGIGFANGALERDPVCASDYYQHVLYARLSSGPDRYSEVAPQIQAAIRRMNAVLSQESVDSGGQPADYRMLCTANGQVRVDSFLTQSTDFRQIVATAKTAGFSNPHADYTIFFDGGDEECGVGSYIPDEDPSAENLNNGARAGYAVIYEPCWFNETPMHESAHSQGAVQYDAPNSTGIGGHCIDEEDVMCYSPDGGDLNQSGTVLRCLDRAHFDCGNDDYFDAAPEPGEYLSANWNLGSSVNRFIAFGGAPNPQPEPETPVPDVVPGAPDPEQVIHKLRPGLPFASTTPAPGEWQYFRLNVGRGERLLRTVLNGPACDGAACTNIDLYLRRNAKPTTARWACAAQDVDARERCTVRRPHRGTWFAGVYTVSGAEGLEFSIRALSR